MPSARSLIMEGDFHAFSVEEVLDAVSLTRQCVEVVFADEQRDRGAIFVKSGQVLMAELPPSHNGRDAFLQLVREPCAAFRVYRHPTLAGEATPIGTLSELLAASHIAPTPVDEGPVESLVVEGHFHSFAIDDLLDVMGMSRQLMRLETVGADGEPGLVLAKAGRLLHAELPARQLQGYDAFLALFLDPGDRFTLHVVHHTRVLPAPLERLSDAVARATAVRDAGPQAEAHASRVVLEGDFATFSITDVFDVVSLSRQTLELLLLDDRGLRGTIVVQSGRVRDAVCLADGTRGYTAFASLYQAPGTAFRVMRRAEGAGADQPNLGPLDSLIARVVAAATPAADDIVIKGRVDDLGLDQVFSFLAMSRQCLALRTTEAGAPKASLLVKAGQVLGASHGSLTGTEAVTALVADPGDAFVVTRARRAGGASLGDLSRLVDAARASVARPVVAEPDLAGSFADMPLDEVLDVIGLSRQVLELTVSVPEGATAVFQAGRLLEARCGQRTGKAAFARLVTRAAGTFTLRRLPHRIGAVSLGRIDELVQAARALEERAKQRIQILSGSFDHHGLLEVLEVVGLSRQLLELSFQVDGKAQGGLLVKSGHILTARTRQHPNEPGRAIADLLAAPGDSFVLYQRHMPSDPPPPIARLEDVVSALLLSIPEPVEAEVPEDDDETDDTPLPEATPAEAPASPSSQQVEELTATLAALRGELAEQRVRLDTVERSRDLSWQQVASLVERQGRSDRMLLGGMVLVNFASLAVVAATLVSLWT